MEELITFLLDKTISWPNKDNRTCLLRYNKHNNPSVKDIYFKVNDSELSLYWDLFCKMQTNRTSNTYKNVEIYEISDDNTAIMMDVVFSEKIQNYDFLKLLILELKSIINDYIIIDDADNKEEIFTAIIWNMQPTRNIYRIIFPFIYTHKLIIKEYIYKILLENIEIKGLYQSINHTNYHIDIDIYTNPINMYGLSDNREIKIYAQQNNRIKELDIDDLMDKKYKTFMGDSKTIINELLTSYNNAVFIIPLICSLHKNKSDFKPINKLYTKTFMDKIDKYKELKHKEIHEVAITNRLCNYEDLTGLKNKVQTLLRMINYKRINDENIVEYIITLFFNIFKEKTVYDIETFADILQDDSNYDTIFEGVSGYEFMCRWFHFALNKYNKPFNMIVEFINKVELKWNELNYCFVNYFMIEQMANDDNSELYIAWKSQDDENIKTLLSTKECTHNGLAIILKKIYGEVLVCVNSENGTGDWFYYDCNKHKWIFNKRGIIVKQKIVIELLNYYVKRSNIETELVNTNNTDINLLFLLKEAPHLLQNTVTTVKGPFNEIITKLQDATFIEKVLKMCMIHFNNSYFEEVLNKNKNLIGFPNGVYEINTHTFRAGRPNDYISHQMGVAFKDYSLEPNHPFIQEIETFYKKVYVDDDLRRFIMRYDASCLEPTNTDRICMLLYGKGMNAKTLKNNFLSYIMGDYFGTMPIQFMFEQHESSSSGNPMLASLNGKRLVYAEESKNGMKFNDGRFKMLTGNSIMATRSLYSNTIIKFKATFKFAMGMNDVQNFGNNPAVWDRLRHIPHESVFSEDAPDDLKTQFELKHFKANNKYEDQFPNLGDAYVWVLLQTLKDYHKYGLGPVPQKVKDATEKHKKANDPLLMFKLQNLTWSDNILETPTTIDKLYDAYKVKINKDYPLSNKQLSDKEAFKESIRKYIGEPSEETDSKCSWNNYFVNEN